MIRDDAGPASFGPSWTGIATPSRPAPQLRRRVAVFGFSFVLLAVASLLYDYSRPAEYRSDARLRIDVSGQDAETGGTPASAAFLTEVEFLTSRPLIDEALARLSLAGEPLPEGSDDGYGPTLEATPVEGTNVVELTATGRPREALAPLVNALIATYRARLPERFRQDSDGRAAKAQDEADQLAARIAEKRRALDDFRGRYDIVSLEREENQLLSRVKGVGQSLNAANDRLVAAEAKLRSLQESIAAGKTVGRARDNATLSNLEQRASQLREEQHEMERTYTPDFLAFDPRAKALRLRIANLDEQMRQAREGGQRVALQDAEEEVAAARAAVDRLSQRAGGDRDAARAFAARLGEFKAMQEELGGLEETHRTTVVRATRLRAAETSHMPEVTTLEPALAPGEPWRPRYARDAAIGVSASLLLALLTTWIVELFNRSPPGPSLVVAPAWLGGLPSPAARPPESLAQVPPSALLAGVAPLPRELDEDEVLRLLDELRADGRTVGLGLLSGLTVEELLRLTWASVDLDGGRILLPDRSVTLSHAFATQLAGERERCMADADAAVVASGSADAIDAALLCAAHDAGLAGADEVTAAALRHSYVAYLVRQGVRFGDLSGIVGRLPADLLGAYGALAPAGKKPAAEGIDRVHPALRRLRTA